MRKGGLWKIAKASRGSSRPHHPPFESATAGAIYSIETMIMHIAVCKHWWPMPGLPEYHL